MKMRIDANQVSVRDLSESAVPSIVDYWYRSPPGFVESMSVDLAKLPAESEMRNFLIGKIRENQTANPSKLNALTIVYDGRPIGFHTINPVTEGESGIFHAHIWDPSFRRCGIGLISYPMACLKFFDRFNLEKILFKTPEQNIGSIKVKEKLGLRETGMEKVGFGIIKDGTLARVFELTKIEAQAKWPRID